MSHFVFGNMLWNLFWNNLHIFWYKDCCFSYSNFSILLTGLRLFQWLCFSHLIMICLKTFLGFLEFLSPPPIWENISTVSLNITSQGWVFCLFFWSGGENFIYLILSQHLYFVFFSSFFLFGSLILPCFEVLTYFFPAICYLFLISFSVFISDNYCLSVEVLFLPFLFWSCYCFPLPVLTFRAYL